MIRLAARVAALPLVRIGPVAKPCAELSVGVSVTVAPVQPVAAPLEYVSVAGDGGSAEHEPAFATLLTVSTPAAHVAFSVGCVAHVPPVTV